MFIDGRLALEQGKHSIALALLTKAQELLKTESADGQIKPAVLAPLIREASLEDRRPESIPFVIDWTGAEANGRRGQHAISVVW